MANHSGGVMSVLVTPVSTLTYAARREHPGLNQGRREACRGPPAGHP